MTPVIWLPLVANALLAATGPWLARRLPPRSAVRLLTFAMLATAAGSGLVLAVLGLLLVAQQPLVAALGHWSTAALRTSQPVPAWIALPAGVTALALLTAAVRRAVAGGHDLVRAALACRRLGPATAGLVVLEAGEPDAYALPGGRIVVSRSMLDALHGEERHVLLAHEAAHLACGHHLFLQLVELAAAASPILRPTAAAVRLAVEREADEAAAVEVGDRRLVARGLARAGLARAEARRSARTHAAALPGADGFLVQRAAALLAPAPRARRPLAAALVVLTVATLAVSALTARQTDDRLDDAVTAMAPASASH